MKYALIIDNIVVQVQPNEQQGFIEVSDNVICGMIKDGDAFVNPIIIKTLEEIEDERIALIKSKANEVIVSKYSIIWQLNHPRLDETYSHEYDWIDNIRRISNEAESNGTDLEDINWGI